MATLSMKDATERVGAVLRAAGASDAMAGATARALVRAEAQGLGSHGFSRVGQYTTHLRNGRADGQAVPSIAHERDGAVLVDAHEGLAFEACEFAVREAIDRARRHGISIAAVTNSHHCGVVLDHLAPIAEAGLVGLGFANSPAAMPMAGGRHPIFGTNPIAAVFPRREGLPLGIDLSLSEVARGKVMVAAREGRAIPAGWALDKAGQPTTDAKAALEGSMLPVGAASSSKGAMLALTVELLVSALTGAHFGSEASSFFVDEGNRPRLGQAFIVIDPGALVGQGGYLDRVEALVAEMLTDEDVRLPGVRRAGLLEKARVDGIRVPDELLAQWEVIASR